MKNFLFLLFFTGSLLSCNMQPTPSKLQYVDTRVGTDASHMLTAGRFGKGSEEYGQTLPAVLEPNGMNFWTPQTRDTEKKCITPYYYQDSLFMGFRNSHWIVGGCTQDYGSMTLMPATDIKDCRPMKRGLSFKHDTEIATPAYYSVMLDQANMQAEMTGRSRSAIFRLTYPADGPAYLIVNPNSDEGEGYIELDTLKKEIRGYNPIHRIYQGWGKPAGYSGHFIIRYNDELKGFGTYCQDTIFEGQTQIGKAKGIGLYIAFERQNPEKPIIVKAASSFTGQEGARKNLDAEIPHWDFEQTRNELTEIWEKHLGRVEATSVNDTLSRKLYGAIYRASCLPRVISDVDGRYPAFSKGTPIMQAPEGTQHYDDFSMWDTYRALHPLLTLLTPTKSGEMMQSLVDKYKQGGWLPIFPCWNSYTAAMIGDHCTAAIGDAYIKGVHNFDIETAYEGMWKNAFETPENYEDYANGMGRRALKSYMEYGYIPLEDLVKEAFHSREQSSRTLEYAFDDFVLSQIAKELQKTEDYKLLAARSRNFKNVIDPQTGYANGRYADGHFYEENKTDNFAFYITEGAPCHYTWYAPQDPYGLMEAMGGKDNYIAKLDTLFEEKLYWHGNEPCHQVAYMYNYAGQPWKTQKYTRHVMDTEYGDIPGGLAGNDDAGQMSAWYIFSSIGFYPVCPGSPYYIIGSPRMEKVTLNLENGKRFTIVAEATGNDNRYIQQATLNGKPYTKNYLHHNDLITGGTLHLVMGDQPNKEWGSKPEDCPPVLLP